MENDQDNLASLSQALRLAQELIRKIFEKERVNSEEFENVRLERDALSSENKRLLAEIETYRRDWVPNNVCLWKKSMNKLEKETREHEQTMKKLQKAKEEIILLKRPTSCAALSENAISSKTQSASVDLVATATTVTTSIDVDDSKVITPSVNEESLSKDEMKRGRGGGEEEVHGKKEDEDDETNHTRNEQFSQKQNSFEKGESLDNEKSRGMADSREDVVDAAESSAQNDLPFNEAESEKVCQEPEPDYIEKKDSVTEEEKKKEIVGKVVVIRGVNHFLSEDNLVYEYDALGVMSSTPKYEKKDGKYKKVSVPLATTASTVSHI